MSPSLTCTRFALWDSSELLRYQLGSGLTGFATKICQSFFHYYNLSGAIMDYVATLVGVPLIPSYVPRMFSHLNTPFGSNLIISAMVMQSTDTMTFYERTKSFVGHGLMKLIWPRNIPVTETQIFREEFDPNFPNLLDIAEDCPLVN